MTDEAMCVVVGALARVDAARREEVRAALAARTGISTFDVDDPDQLGVLIETDSIERAHELLVGEVRTTRGVLAAWPISMEWDVDDRDPSNATNQRENTRTTDQ